MQRSLWVSTWVGHLNCAMGKKGLLVLECVFRLFLGAERRDGASGSRGVVAVAMLTESMDSTILSNGVCASKRIFEFDTVTFPAFHTNMLCATNII